MSQGGDTKNRLPNFSGASQPKVCAEQVQERSAISLQDGQGRREYLLSHRVIGAQIKPRNPIFTLPVNGKHCLAG